MGHASGAAPSGRHEGHAEGIAAGIGGLKPTLRFFGRKWTNDKIATKGAVGLYTNFFFNQNLDLQVLYYNKSCRVRRYSCGPLGDQAETVRRRTCGPYP